MNQQKVNYIISAAIVVLALILGFFGMTLPVVPEIPAPLPTATPYNLSPLTEQLDVVSTQVDVMGDQVDAVGEQVDSVGERVDAIEAQALLGEDPLSFSTYNTACYQEQGGAKWVAGEGCEWEMQSGATLDLQAGVVLLPSFNNITITNGYTLTPTSNVYALDSAGAVTMTLAASATEGQSLTLIGDDANTITIADTNIRTTTGAALTLGQYDVIVFVYQDSEWLEVSLSANQ